MDAYGRQIPERTQRKIKPFGQQGDVVDYVFENVESYACNEKMPDDRKMLTSSMPAVTPEQENHRGVASRIQHVYEPEDEIQLYFRPKKGKGKRKRRKGDV